MNVKRVTQIWQGMCQCEVYLLASLQPSYMYMYVHLHMMCIINRRFRKLRTGIKLNRKAKREVEAGNKTLKKKMRHKMTSLITNKTKLKVLYIEQMPGIILRNSGCTSMLQFFSLLIIGPLSKDCWLVLPTPCFMYSD